MSSTSDFTLAQVSDRETAIAFLQDLCDRDMMFHPDDRADDCLRDLGLPADTLADIDAQMAAAHKHLECVASECLKIMEAAGK